MLHTANTRYAKYLMSTAQVLSLTARCTPQAGFRPALPESVSELLMHYRTLDQIESLIDENCIAQAWALLEPLLLQHLPFSERCELESLAERLKQAEILAERTKPQETDYDSLMDRRAYAC